MKALFFVLALSGCGQIKEYYLTPEEVCAGGIMYLVFHNGVTVKYAKDGSIAKCVNKKTAVREKMRSDELLKELRGGSS